MNTKLLTVLAILFASFAYANCPPAEKVKLQLDGSFAAEDSGIKWKEVMGGDRDEINVGDEVEVISFKGVSGYNIRRLDKASVVLHKFICGYLRGEGYIYLISPIDKEYMVNLAHPTNWALETPPPRYSCGLIVSNTITTSYCQFTEVVPPHSGTPGKPN
ncbi:MAG TPA: hypothetical protein VKR58_04610 [Aquella sp.]|nr:hypothetical protein [Aquella sp.]